MASYNRVILMGNLTRDPEVRYTPSGTAVCDLRLAVNDRVKQGEEWVDKPVYVDVTVWAKQAENCGQYLRKGSPVLLDGRLQMDEWTDKEGNKRTKLKIVADRVQFIGSPARAGEGGREEDARPPRRAEPAGNARPDEGGPGEGGAGDFADDDNLPF